MANYVKQMQGIVSQYRVSGHPWPASSRAMAEWAIHEGLWELTTSAVVSRCTEDISRAMREEYMTDSKGRRRGAGGESGGLLLREAGKDRGSAVHNGARASHASPWAGAGHAEPGGQGWGRRRG